ncbi:MAG: glutamate synthase central domain-containing protein, partial [Kiritimatiellae bacterium]|nr:glutamate synthase central domain-containing protein [Kiritimatiellia bacterium]
MVCSLRGEKSHEIVTKALGVLANLEHRGATGYDPDTGDGSGILLHVPHAFFSEEVAGLPDAGAYGVGMVFLPQDPASRARCERTLEVCFTAEGLEILTWRDVPVCPEAVGESGRSTQPVIRQVFVGCGRVARERLDRHLFIARKVAENEARRVSLAGDGMFYLPSCSSRTIVYKGLMRSFRVADFYPELRDPRVTSGLALVHQRYSTNTFPAWPLAQPFRLISHNGEINTLRGNLNWMRARQGLFRSELLGTGLERLFPILTEGASDSAILDNAIELLYHAGRSLPHAVLMLIPEAWHHNATMSAEKKAFYEYHACLMEPWDGPASIPFTDGDVIGAVLDRNGLRPSRYTVTKDGLVIMASETGVLEIAPENVERKGRLQPGRMFLVDTRQGRVVDDEEIKAELCARKPYQSWLQRKLLELDDLPAPREDGRLSLAVEALAARQRLFGYSIEDLKIILAPMGRQGAEPTGSMGNDVPLAVLSERPRLFFDYFHQLFAQVTNPPLDAIREELVTSLQTYMGKRGNLLDEGSEPCGVLRLAQPIINENELIRIRDAENGVVSSVVLPTIFDVTGDGPALQRALVALCDNAAKAVMQGRSFLILSDRAADSALAPIPSLLALSAVHQHLVRHQLRTQVALISDSGDAREVHHSAALIGFGADAVCPYLALATLRDLCARKLYLDDDPEEACASYVKAVGKGLLKVMSKMGISTLQSYCGAQ